MTPEKISKDEYFLFLTEKGGIFWEKSRKPNWNNFVNTGTYFDSKFCYLEIDSFQPRLIFQYFNQHLMESAYNSIYDIQFLAKNERIVYWKNKVLFYRLLVKFKETENDVINLDKFQPINFWMRPIVSKKL